MQSAREGNSEKKKKKHNYTQRVVVSVVLKSCPCTRSKNLTSRDRLDRYHLGIRRVLPYVIAPPAEVNTAQLQGKEDDDGANDDACVEPRSKQIIVPHPPTEVEASREPLEDETNNDP